MAGSQDYAPDPRNARIRVYLNGDLVPRDEAKVSIFDAGFALGDGVWEGLRLHKRRFMFLDAHLDRLFKGAQTIGLDIGLDRAGVEAALRATVKANRMTDGVHLRLMVTRGLKATVNQDPRNALGQPTVVITAEYKATNPPEPGKGLNLHTSTIRCTPRDMFDMRLNSHSRLNLITALLEAIEAGADEALMLDPNGFVSSCNATNFFFARGGALYTSTGDYCFNGVTRANIIALARENSISLRMGAFPRDAARGADEAFVTGTLGGVTPVRRIDGRDLPQTPGPVTMKLRDLYLALMDKEAAA